MNETVIPAEGYAFPVDLDRAEYVRFNMRIAKMRGLYRFRGVMLTAFGFSLALAAVLLAMDFYRYRTVDSTLVALMVFVLLAGATLLFGVPNYIRIKAGRTYDRSLLSGHEYYGVVRVYQNRIEKTGGGRTTTLPFDRTLVYAEYEDMMVFAAPAMPAIILTARCVTEEDAQVVRDAVRTAIRQEQQLLFARMISRAAVRLDMPPDDADAEPDELLMRLHITYTQEEFLGMVTRGAWQAFFKMLPLFAGVALIAALALGMSGGPFTMALIFLGVLLFVMAVNVGGTRWRTRLRMPAMDEDALTVHLHLSERGITLFSATRNSLFYPWISGIRVAEKPDWVELQLNGSFMEIPWRCIPEPELLRDIVNAHLNRE